MAEESRSDELKQAIAEAVSEIDAIDYDLDAPLVADLDALVEKASAASREAKVVLAHVSYPGWMHKASYDADGKAKIDSVIASDKDHRKRLEDEGYVYGSKEKALAKPSDVDDSKTLIRRRKARES